MHGIQLIRRLARDVQGAAAIEFALVAIPLFLLLLGAIEFGLIGFTQLSIESALTEAARDSSIQADATNGVDRTAIVVKEVQDKLAGLPRGNLANVTAGVVTNAGVSPTIASDVCLVDANNPYPATCTNADGTPGNYQEHNGIQGYQASSGGTVGSEGQLVEIRVEYPWRIIMPLFDKFFPDGVYEIDSTIVFRNEPKVN